MTERTPELSVVVTPFGRDDVERHQDAPPRTLPMRWRDGGWRVGSKLRVPRGLWEGCRVEVAVNGVFSSIPFSFPDPIRFCRRGDLIVELELPESDAERLGIAGGRTSTAR